MRLMLGDFEPRGIVIGDALSVPPFKRQSHDLSIPPAPPVIICR